MTHVPDQALYGTWRTLGGLADVAAAARSLRSTMGGGCFVGVALPDAAGRLRLGWEEGEAPRAERRRSAMRRRAFRTRTVRRIEVDAGRSLVLLPLLSDGTSLGVLEVGAATPELEAAAPAMQAAAEEVATALRSLCAHAVRRRELETLERTTAFGHELLSASDPEESARTIVRFIFECWKRPVAAWSITEGSDGYALASVHGIDVRRRRAMGASLGSIPAWDRLSEPDRRDLVERFVELAGIEHVVRLAGDGLLILADDQGPAGPSLRALWGLIEQILLLRASAAHAQRRSDELDLGLAWIAHELRGPVLGVKAALEHLVDRGQAGDDPILLRRSLRELERLAGTTEGLLGWAVGARPLHLRQIDLGRLVDEAVESCILETGNDSILVLGSEGVVVRADPVQLRMGVANLIRNALSFSQAGEKVEVRVELANGSATIAVSDQGPGIAPAEGDIIFDPFMRGSASSRSRSGSGLGLFIARRVVEAHGGRIWPESDGHGATFLIRLPAEEGVIGRCAS